MASTSADRIDVPALARRFARVFPHLDARSGRVAVTLYRLLGRGAPVPWATLAKATGQEMGALRALVSGWPGVDEEPAGLVAFGGLSVRAASPHVLRLGGRTLHARCAWDTLFLPGVLGGTAEVESTCGQTGQPVRLRVSPAALERLEPPGTLLSLLEPREEMVADLPRLF